MVKKKNSVLRAAIYARVSTSHGQTVMNQVGELKSVARHRHWGIVEVYADEGISGAKEREKRPALKALMNSVTRGELDIVAAWSVDRLGRSLLDLMGTLHELQAANVDLYLHQQALDTTTPSGRALFGMLGIFAEFERAVMRERVLAGLARARQEGKRLGRPTVSSEIEAAIRAQLAKGTGIQKTARLCGVGVSVVQRITRE